MAFGQQSFGQYPGYQAAMVSTLVASPKKFKVIQGVGAIGVRGDQFEILFSTQNAGLVSYRCGGRELLAGIPKPNFWRAPNDNDNGNQMQQRYAQWKIASLYGTTKIGWGTEYTITYKDGSVAIDFRYKLPTTPESDCHLAYEVFADGRVEAELSYDWVKELGDMPEFGVLFPLKADLNQVEWYGLGPDETYVDRCQGGRLGIYRNQVADNMAKYLNPQECGNKLGVRYAKITDAKGRGMLFEYIAPADAEEKEPLSKGLSFSALPYTPHEMELATHEHELPPVYRTIVRVAESQMGVAGDDTWGARVLPEYLIQEKEQMRFRFAFRGI